MRLKNASAEKENARPRQSRVIHWLGWGLGLLVVVLLLAKVAFSLNIMWQIFNFAFQVDESEGMIVAETLLIDRGVDIYAPLTNQRFIAAPYTPLYYLLNLPALHLTGASFKPGRFISFLAWGGIAFLLFNLVQQYTLYSNSFKVRRRLPEKEFRVLFGSNWYSGLLAALFWLALALPAFWGSVVKPDILALFFTFAGLYAVFKYSTRPGEPGRVEAIRAQLKRDRWLYLGAALFACAILTKQTAFAGVLASVAFLFFGRSFGAGFRLLGAWAVLSFGPMLVMNWLSHGGFWYHTITVHQLPWSFENYWKFFSALVQNYLIFVLLGLAFPIFWLVQVARLTISPPRDYPSLPGNSVTPLFMLYLATSWGATISAGTYGGNHNHLLEFAAALCLCSGLLLGASIQWFTSDDKLRGVFPLLLLLVGLQTLGLFVGEARVRPENIPLLGSLAPTQAGLQLLHKVFFNPQWLGLEYRVPPEKQKEGLAQVAAFMTNDTGPLIYSDNVSLWLASGKPVLTTDPFTQTHATELKRWDESYLIQLIEQRQFHLIVLRAPIEERQKGTGEVRDIYLSPGLARAIVANYQLTQANVAFIYEPQR